jgi:long-chain acyl-CoA synthetase
MNNIPPIIIEQFCFFEKEKANSIFLSEPVGGKYHPFTWQQAGDEIRKMASYLQKSGLNPGDKVAILSKNCAHWIMADLAIAFAGMVAVPLYPNISADAIREILIHSETKTIFVGKLDNPHEIRKGIPASLEQISFPFYFNEGCINWDDIIQNNPPITGTPSIDRHSLACIIYTSGTTGNPKGVMLSFHAMAFAVDSFLKSNPPFINELFFSYLPLCHVAEKMLVEAGGIFTGGTIYFVESMDTFSKNLADTQPTVFLAVPRIWEKFQQEILKKIPQKKLDRILSIPIINSLFKKAIRKKLGLGRYKHAYTGASPIHKSLLEWFNKLGIEIQEAYGMTENSALSHVNRKGSVRFGAVGQTYPDVVVKLSEVNEVLVKSEANMLGYYKEPVLTAEMFEDGYLKTGDEGHIDDDGFLFITGRIKDQFKTSKGKYVTPAPIEMQVLADPCIAQTCVVGWGQPAPLLLCTLTENALKKEHIELSSYLKKFLKQINSDLEHHEQLAKLIVMKDEWTIQNGLLTPTLKIKRKMIDQQFERYYSDWYNTADSIIFL